MYNSLQTNHVGHAILYSLHVAVVHVSRLVLLVYYSVECHQGSMCCRMTIVVRVMTFPKLSCA